MAAELAGGEAADGLVGLERMTFCRSRPLTTVRARPCR
jgi:hypothetical protein